MIKFAETLEDVVVKSVESGAMTKDLAMLVGPISPGSPPKNSSTRSTRISPLASPPNLLPAELSESQHQIWCEILTTRKRWRSFPQIRDARFHALSLAAKNRRRVRSYRWNA